MLLCEPSNYLKRIQPPKKKGEAYASHPRIGGGRVGKKEKSSGKECFPLHGAKGHRTGRKKDSAPKKAAELSAKLRKGRGGWCLYPEVS